MTSLSARLKLALSQRPDLSRVALARACGVTPQAIHAWLVGKTKKVEHANVMAAARALGVSPDWLASGKGPMRDENVKLPTASQSVSLDPDTMLRALRYLERRAMEHGQRFDPFTDPDLLCRAYEIEAAVVAAPSNVIDFGQEVLKRFSRGDGRDAKGRAG